MNRYAHELPSEVIAVLAAARGGVVRVGVEGRSKHVEGFQVCEIELASGHIITVCADGYDLEFKFEVFPITAKLSPSAQPDEMKSSETQPMLLQAPVAIALLQTEDWLDPSIPCPDTIGENPVMQRGGLPGEAPATAIAACTYIGGVEFRGSTGGVLTIVTLPFPYSIYVSDFPESGEIDRRAYAAVSLDENQPL